MAATITEQIIVQQQQQKHTCVNCRIRFDSIELQRAHFKTSWHLYNLKRKVCKLEPIDLEGFTKIQEAAEVLENQSSRNQSRRNSISLEQTKRDRAAEEHRGKTIPEQGEVNEDDDEANWEEVDDEELVDEDYDEEEVEAMLAQVVHDDTCLFCSKKCSDIPSNLAHMNLHHGFFIPEEQYLIDLEGLMRYLGFKVGAGATCLWCNKQFAAPHGAQLHMRYKDHCKIFYEQKQAIDEFKDFYDYATQEQIPMKTPSQLDIVRRRSKRNDDHRAIIATKSSTRSNQLATLAERTMIAVQKKNIKKFNAQRAKNLLRVGMTNNMAVRGRLRQQNPI